MGVALTASDHAQQQKRRDPRWLLRRHLANQANEPIGRHALMINLPVCYWITLSGHFGAAHVSVEAL